MKKVILISILLLLVLGGYVVFQKINKSQSPATAIIAQAAIWLPEATWSKPSSATETTQYGEIKGIKTTATITTQTASIPHFENATFLGQYGFKADNNLAADGPGSSVWGYKKANGSTNQFVIFSYNTVPTSTNLNEPLQFNCPCKTTVSVFVSQ